LLLCCTQRHSIPDNLYAEALLDAHKRGVRIRIISDDDQMASNGSDVQRLRNAGIAGHTLGAPLCWVDINLQVPADETALAMPADGPSNAC